MKSLDKSEHMNVHFNISINKTFRVPEEGNADMADEEEPAREVGNIDEFLHCLIQ